MPFIDDKGEEEAKQVVKLVERALPKGDVAILARSRAHVASTFLGFVPPGSRTKPLRLIC